MLIIYGRVITELTHWGRVMHICVSKLTIIGSDNDLGPGQRHAIIWTNAGMLLIRTLGTTNFSEIFIKIHTFSFKKMDLKYEMPTILYKPQCVNTLWLKDGIWRWWSWSALLQVIPCCLMAPRHYLNRCWLLISWKIFWIYYIRKIFGWNSFKFQKFHCRKFILKCLLQIFCHIIT